MKYFAPLLFLLLISPFAVAQQQYREVIIIFFIDFDTWVEADHECQPGLDKVARLYSVKGINPTFGSRFKIYAATFSGKSGRVSSERGNEIGEILICHDQTSLPPERNLQPVYYEFDIGKRTFVAVGGGTSVNFPELDRLPGGNSVLSPPGFPSANRVIYHVNATVLSSIPGFKGGSYMQSALLGESGDSGDGLTSNVIHILRVYIPVEPEEQN